MVRDEADLIESFVRYHCEMVDHMLVVDHLSSDATPQILDALVAEGLPLTRVRENRADMAQAEVTSHWMRRTARDQDADWVLPLDADEFLAAEGDKDPRDLLHGLVNTATNHSGVLLLPMLALAIPASSVWPDDWPFWLQVVMAIIVLDLGVAAAHHATESDFDSGEAGETARRAAAVKAVAFFQRARESRAACSPTSAGEQAGDYNPARGLHQMGLPHLAVPVYEKVLDGKTRAGVPATPAVASLAFEAAHNLALIYKNAGALSLARDVLRAHATV